MLRMTSHLSKVGLLIALATALGCPFAGPFLQVYPAGFDFGESLVTDTFSVANAGQAILTWVIDETPDWLTVEPSSGTVEAGEMDLVTMTATRTGIDPGVYSGRFTVRSNDGDQTIRVSMTVLSPPLLQLTPTTLDLGLEETSGDFAVSNAGNSALDWSLEVTEGITWLAATPISGITDPGEEETVQVSVDRSGLAAGLHEGTITVTSNGGNANVNVRVLVSTLSVSPTAFDFGLVDTTDTLTLSNQGASAVTWTIAVPTADATWLSVSATTGALDPGEETTIDVAVDRTPLGPGSTEGTFTVSTDVVDVPVTVNVSVAALTASPEVLDLGETTESGTFTLSNVGDGALSWEASLATGVNWVTLSTLSGDLDEGADQDVTVTVDRDLLSSGAYETPVTVDSTAGTVVVTVRMTVPERDPGLAVLPQVMNFSINQTDKLLAIWNVGTGTVTWSIDDSGFPSWLSLSPASPSGAVGGAATDSVHVLVDRAGLAPGDYSYAAPGIVVSSDAGEATVAVYMTVAALPVLSIDTDGRYTSDPVPIPYVFVEDNDVTTQFAVENVGTGTLSWSLEDTDAFPTWLESVLPQSGSVEPGASSVVTVTISRDDEDAGGYQHELSITSNGGDATVRVEMNVPQRATIGVSPGEINFGLDGVSSEFFVANLGDPGTRLDFIVTSDKPWLFFYPETGQSIGTAAAIKDWQQINVSIDRGGLEETGAVGTLTAHAYELDSANNVVLLDDIIEPATVTVSVEASSLTIETARARTRIPSLVRFVLLMRNLKFQSMPLPYELLDDYAPLFRIFEDDLLIEAAETNQFLTSSAHIRQNIAILLDYSGSMDAAAATAVSVESGLDISGEADPLQALYELTVTPLITDLLDFLPNCRVALMEFHDRSQATRVVSGGDFTDDAPTLIAALEGLSVEDRGATELIPAVVEAADLLVAEDAPFLSFDNADVKMVVCITDGRMTTPPGDIQETGTYLYDAANVRVMFVGWGNGINNEPLARISSDSGGHYYPTLPGDGNLPVVDNLYDWCEAEDLGVDPCDQSVARDLQSQVVLSYATLNEQASTEVRINAAFDDPNDDDATCLADQGIVEGSTDQTIDFDVLVGDVRMGQISMRTSGILGDQASVIIRAEYMPRNISSFEFTLGSDPAHDFSVAIVPLEDGGLVEGWTLGGPASGAGTYTLTAPAGEVLRYGAFGDLLEVTFATDTPFRFGLTVNNAIYADKYFIYPDTIPVGADDFLAPAFPTPLVTPESIDFGSGTAGDFSSAATFTIQNIGGTYDYPPGTPTVYLHWSISSTSDFLTASPLEGYVIQGTLDSDTVTVTLDRSAVDPGAHIGFVTLTYDGNLSLTEGSIVVPVLLDILDPDMAISPTTLDFGYDETSLSFEIANTGQSNFDWDITSTPALPDWITLSDTSGNVAADSQDVTVTVDRTDADPGVYDYALDVQAYDSWGDAFGAPITVQVHVVVPGLTLSEDELDFGETDTSLVVTLTNVDDEEADCTATWSASWITSVTPDSGILLAGASAPITIQVDRTGLAAGTYEDTISFLVSGVVNVELTVEMTVP